MKTPLLLQKNLTQEIQSLSPTVSLSVLQHKDRKIFVAREDLLPGGTKQRAIGHFAIRMNDAGIQTFVYPSPFCGFAQVALAYVCRMLQLNCIIVAEETPQLDPKNIFGQMHGYTSLAKSYGAKIILAKSLADAENKAALLCHGKADYYKAPLGFDCTEYKDLLKFELKKQWEYILRTIPDRPRTLWLPVGSGTLAQVFSEIVSSDTRLHCLNVHVLPQNDTRIQKIRENPAFTLFSSKQKFAEAATELPEIPSNIHYDAKLWSFIAQYGQCGDVWWNVGR
jgi:hypothetical protein